MSDKLKEIKKTVDVHLYTQSQPVTHIDYKNTYTKDGFYCIMMQDGDVYKYPSLHIFRVKEYTTKGQE